MLCNVTKFDNKSSCNSCSVVECCYTKTVVLAYAEYSTYLSDLHSVAFCYGNMVCSPFLLMVKYFCLKYNSG